MWSYNCQAGHPSLGTGLFFMALGIQSTNWLTSLLLDILEKFKKPPCDDLLLGGICGGI